MAPILTEFIVTAYEAINTAGNTMSAIKKGLKLGINALSCLDISGITLTINTFLSMLEEFAEWLFKKICDDFKDSILLACLLRYMPPSHTAICSRTSSEKLVCCAIN
jgi:hypothetical protein